MECVRCGAAAVIEGSLMDGCSGGDVHFCSSDTSYMKRMFSVGSRKIKASHPQPGVLDRIAELSG